MPCLVVVQEFLSEDVAADVLTQESAGEPWFIARLADGSLSRTESAHVLDVPGERPARGGFARHILERQRHISVGPFDTGEQSWSTDAVRLPDLREAGLVDVGLAPPVVPVAGVVGGRPASVGRLVSGEELQSGAVVTGPDAPDPPVTPFRGVVREGCQKDRSRALAEDRTRLVLDMGEACVVGPSA
ncbi:hypothetical protein [Streptomyces sp. NPDC000618]|uniref:hypothetical protein n=1 Tax=Streptomyces sp. NPDC000618 TaxID=3154265 RepID=UPI00332BCB52